MPKVNWDDVKEGQKYPPVPEGTYKAKVVNVEEVTTKKGDPMWKVRLEIVEGPQAGQLLFDNIVWSEAALSRAKMIYSRLGLETSGLWDASPADIFGKQAFVTVGIQEYMDGDGNTKERNQIPYDGYQMIPDMDGGEEALQF